MALPSGSGYATADILNPGSALTDFSLLIDLSRLPQSWWDQVDTTDGTRGRAAKDNETELAADWIEFDPSAQTGWVRVLWSGTLSATGTETLRIYPPQAGNSAYAATDTYGQYNAYDTDWAGYWPDGGGTDRTATQNNGTANGGVTEGGISGEVGAATDYDGSDDSYTLEPTDLPGGTAARHLFAFARVDNIASDTHLLAYGASSPSDGESWRVAVDDANGGELVVRVQSGARRWGSNLDDNAWHHYSISFDGTATTNHNGWIDGTDLGNGSGNTQSMNTGQDEALLGADIGFFGEGDIDLDDVQMHSTARSSDWVDHEYTQATDQATFYGTWSWESSTPTASPNSLTHGHTLEQGSVSVSFQANPNSLTQGHTLESPAVTPAWSLQPASLTHGHTLSGTAATSLLFTAQPASLVHGHTLSSPSVTTATIYSTSVHDLTHGHTIGAPTLTLTFGASPNDLTQGHTISQGSATFVVLDEPAFFSLDSLDGKPTANIELATEAGAHVLLVARGSGSLTEKEAYYMGVDLSEGTVEIGAFEGSSTRVIATEPFSAASTDRVGLKFQLFADVLLGKAWNVTQGETEPDDWTIEGEDSAIEEDGWAGLVVEQTGQHPVYSFEAKALGVTFGVLFDVEPHSLTHGHRIASTAIEVFGQARRMLLEAAPAWHIEVRAMRPYRIETEGQRAYTVELEHWPRYDITTEDEPLIRRG